ncbi:hypothetical protein D3C87_1091470 [compost metagenome]
MASERIVWHGSGHGAGGFTHFDGDVLTVGQGHHNWRASDWRTDRGGVGDGATFSRRLGGGQFDRRSVDGVRDVGNGWVGARNEVLEVAASGVLDRDFNFAGVFIDVIGGRSDGDGASGFTRLNGDHGAVGQGHGDWRAGRIGQCCGVNDRTAFGHGVGRSQRQVGGVDSVSNSGRNRSLVGNQILVVTAAYVSDRIGQRGVAVQRIVRRSGGHGAGGFADFDGDVLAVGQGHDDRRTGDWSAYGGGVSNGATFSR